jgi:hypothetical protein
VAISNNRLVCLTDGQVTFRYKDYRQGHSQRLMRLPAVEFIRRFLLHSLPKGFVRIRHYGFLANRVRQQNLEYCRRLIGNSATKQSPRVCSQTQPADSGQRTPNWPCPKCRKGEIRFIELLALPRAGPMVA